MATHSKLLIMDPPDRERVLAQASDYLRTQPETSAGEFTLPMVTLVLRTTRDTAGSAGR